VTGRPPFAIAMNQVETLLVSSAGDVLACQCRDAPHQSDRPAQISCQDEMTLVCCEPDDLSAQDAAAGLCGWSSPSRPRGGGGLRGGAPTMTAPMPPLAPTPPTLALRAHQAFRSSRIRDMHADEDSIVPIRSFDYSHFQDGGNDMLPEQHASPPPRASLPSSSSTRSSPPVTHNSPTAVLPLPFFYHGIPTFVSAFAQVRMAQVSAHPAGAHVLCISEAGLLYAYGMNRDGQLGIGIENTVYQASPTIVTPLIEHGGKAIQCAAGVDHSLVVVRTEERRLQHKSGDHFDGAIVHHQVYGFGRNDFMKLGLVSPKVKDASVSLPRRVALHAQIAVGEGGILAVAASAEHSAALVRRSTGAMEVYTWGNATYGALGLPRPMAGLDSPHENPVQVVPVPSFMAACSSSPMAGSFLHPTEVPIQLSLGPRTTHVVTSRGRLFACGSSDTGVLGTGPQATELAMPREVLLPEHVVSCRAGHSHAVATTSAGRAWAWGLAAYTGLQGQEATDEEVVWAPRPLALENVMEAAAGYDATVLVQRDGAVWSWGQATGKLGLGELGQQHVVRKPTRLYGGLRLWRQGVKPVPARRPLLARGVTLG
jgi:alpha-tubulin suppressor-like RCC1 family protein